MEKLRVNEIDDFEVEPLSDEALELVAGGRSSDGNMCCSCKFCSYPPPVVTL
jgi:hypothetical protein